MVPLRESNQEMPFLRTGLREGASPSPFISRNIDKQINSINLKATILKIVTCTAAILIITGVVFASLGIAAVGITGFPFTASLSLHGSVAAIVGIVTVAAGILRFTMTQTSKTLTSLEERKELLLFREKVRGKLEAVISDLSDPISNKQVNENVASIVNERIVNIKKYGDEDPQFKKDTSRTSTFFIKNNKIETQHDLNDFEEKRNKVYQTLNPEENMALNSDLELNQLNEASQDKVRTAQETLNKIRSQQNSDCENILTTLKNNYMPGFHYITPILTQTLCAEPLIRFNHLALEQGLNLMSHAKKQSALTFTIKDQDCDDFITISAEYQFLGVAHHVDNRPISLIKENELRGILDATLRIDVKIKKSDLATNWIEEENPLFPLEATYNFINLKIIEDQINKLPLPDNR
jgi:hypothetical protein